MNKKISVIIVHWNSPDLLKKQLQQLVPRSNLEQASRNNLQIIVVDNASEQPLDWVKKDFPKVELIANNFNYGYAFACNRGVLQAKGEWLLFLNPDVEINQKQIKTIIDYAQNHQLIACSPAVGESYQRPLPSWFSLLIEFTPLKHLSKFIYPEQSRRINFHPIFTLFGGCLLIKKNVLYDLGGWDERFFLWFEDSDLTYRLLRNNYRFGFIPPAEFHRVGVSAPAHIGGRSITILNQQQQRDIFFHSMIVFAQKHFNWWGKMMIKTIQSRFSARKLLPQLDRGIDIVIPNLKEHLLKNFFNQNFQLLDNNVRWIIVSSAIRSTIWDWRKKYPAIRFIPIEKNNGFAPTVNIGFRVSTGNWLGTINDDVVLNDHWLKKLTAVKEKNIGSLNPVILRKNGIVESAGINILAKGKALPLTQHLQKVDAANAAAVLYSSTALDQVGLFDERFGSYLEDIDLSLRLSRAGFKNLVIFNSSVVHLGQQSSITLGWRKHWLDFKNWNLVIVKNWGIKKILLNLPAILIERLHNLSGLIKSIINNQ